MVTYSSEIKEARTELSKLLTRRSLKIEQLEEKKKEQERLIGHLLHLKKGQILAQNAAAELQKNLEDQISNIVTMALAAVFAEPVEFKARFVEKRNQTECDMMFVKDGNEYDPMDDGGGMKDIASFALKLAIWSIHKTRPILILDEPSRNLSRDMQEQCSQLLKMLSTDLGIQIIAVSHIPEMMSAADKIINVVQENGYSTVKTLE